MKVIVSSRYNKKFLILIPLVLSAFIHLWNVSGFPDLFYDEGIYMRRAMHVMAGLGPQEGTFYDHPYFGQLFLAGVLCILNYPSSLNINNASPESLSLLVAVPRLIMGALAIIDTFLIYKITRLRYENNLVALIAATLFAVMPFTWFTRRILLDSILLPFLLSSILLACYANRIMLKNGTRRTSTLLLIFASGVTLGLAIFTKIPSFAAIPVVLYLMLKPAAGKGNADRLVHKNYNNGRQDSAKWNLIKLVVWIAPVIAIPAIWPIHAASVGQYDMWLNGTLHQSTLKNDVITWMWIPFAVIDPVLVVLGVIGLVYAGLKKDYFLLIWFVPFVAFFSVVGYHQYFYVLSFVPALCIASSQFIVEKVKERTANSRLNATKISGSRQAIAWLPLVAIVAFGATCSLILINTNATSAQFQAASFAADYAEKHKDTAIATNPAYSWILSDVFDIDRGLRDYTEIRYYEVDAHYILLLLDIHFQSDFERSKQEQVYEATNDVTTFRGEIVNYNPYLYPYSSILYNSEGSLIEARIGEATVLSPKGLFK